MADYLTMAELEHRTLKEIYTYARELKIPYYSQMNKKELSLAVIRAQAEKQGFFYMEGILDIIGQDGYGFLRPINYGPSAEDIYISNSQIRRFSLRNGDKVAGKARPPKESERYYGLMHVESVNGKDPEEAKERPHFPALTALYPNQKIKLETTPGRLSTRMIDLFSPIGFGQRGLIVAPPKAGKTSILKEIANGITENHPDVELIVLLIDERPEEVTDLERSIKADIVSSTFDLQPSNHTRVAELVLERAMRLVEDKRDVVILMDSLTRLARAYNLVVPPSGRTLSGGIDPAALYKPKKFFGASVEAITRFTRKERATYIHRLLFLHISANTKAPERQSSRSSAFLFHFPQKKNRLHLECNLSKIDNSIFLLFCSVCVFDTVFFVETVHTSVCLCEFLTSSIEWV